LLLRISSDRIKGRRLEQNIFHHSVRCILLQNHIVWTKNVGATYQRAIQTCLGEQIGENAEAYVDDIVVKTKNLDTLIEDLKQTFKNLKKWK
jgi:hypothetical protein